MLLLIGGMLPVIGGLSLTPFSQARHDQPTRFTPLCRLKWEFSARSGQISSPKVGGEVESRDKLHHNVQQLPPLAGAF